MTEIKKIYGIKALYISDNFFIGSKGYRLYRYDFSSGRQYLLAKVHDPVYALLSSFFLTRRFFRAEITRLYSLKDGSMLCIAKGGIFRLSCGTKEFVKCFSITRGSRPLNLCIDAKENIYFGEYFANMQKDAVNIYCSKDKGKTWSVVYTFEKGSINHVHGVFYDNFSKRIWVVTGDRDNECIIANTNDEFKTLNTMFRGGQDFRTCNLMFYNDFVVFATDSQYCKNEIKVFNRDTAGIKCLQNIQGSAIKGGQVFNFSFISTTVEPSDVNFDKSSYLWISKDGKEWEEVFSAKKDFLPSIFQFGSIEFPLYDLEKKPSRFFFSGRALKNIDNKTIEIAL